MAHVCKLTGCYKRCKDSRGKYCSSQCAGVAKRKPPVKCARPGCDGVVTGRDSRRKWCSRVCVDWDAVNVKKAHTLRRHKFVAELRMLADRTITQAQLLAVFARIDARGYKRGWKTRDKGLSMEWARAVTPGDSRMSETWIEMPICPMCRRGMLNGETHTRTITYNPELISAAELDEAIKRGWPLWGYCVVTRQETAA